MVSSKSSSSSSSSFAMLFLSLQQIQSQNITFVACETNGNGFLNLDILSQHGLNMTIPSLVIRLEPVGSPILRNMLSS